MLDGVYRKTEGEPVFLEARAPTSDELQGLLARIIKRLMKMLTRQGRLVEAEGVSHIADIDTNNPSASLQAASCTYRIALGPRTGQKVQSLGTVAGRDEKTTPALCADAHGFSLHAGVRCGAHQRKELERLCRHNTRPRERQRTAASEKRDRPQRGVSARSVFSGADTQIQIADCLVVTWPATA